MGNYRRYRRNATVTDVTAIPQGGSDGITYFKSVVRARKFLIKASCLSEAEQREPKVAAKIKDAMRIVEKADKRNARRRRRRQKTKQIDCSSIDSTIGEECDNSQKPLTELSLQCLDLLKTRKELCEENRRSGGLARRRTVPTEADDNNAVAHFEETLGPEGEIIRFKLHYNKEGQFLKRTRTRLEPQVGDVVLDLTSGIAAWRITRNRRRRHPVTPSMRESYENSFIYKVRKLAAGKYAASNQENLKQFLVDIRQETVASKNKSRKAKKNRKSRKLKKRKNRKK